MTTDHPGSACKQCSRPTGGINGRTLRQSPARRGLLKKADDKHWFAVCPTCERKQLYDDQGIALPFLAADGAMRTVEDTSATALLTLAGFRFSQNALESGLRLANREDDQPQADTSTASVEARAQQYRKAPTAASALRLCIAVCNWGGGGRVLGNLHKRHRNSLGSRMDRWMQAALATDPDEAAIASASSTREAGLPEGLGVSFGSKHLRMLDPDRFAVLDSVLSEGLGYALNPKGYALFMRHLRDFHQHLVATGWPHSLARTESGLFVLVRQNVRADSEQAVTPSEA